MASKSVAFFLVPFCSLFDLRYGQITQCRAQENPTSYTHTPRTRTSNASLLASMQQTNNALTTISSERHLQRANVTLENMLLQHAAKNPQSDPCFMLLWQAAYQKCLSHVPIKGTDGRLHNTRMGRSPFTSIPAWAMGFHCTVLVTAHCPALKTGIVIVQSVPSPLASKVPGLK